MSNEQLFFSWANTAVEPKSIIASSEIMAVSFMMYFTWCWSTRRYRARFVSLR